MQSEKPRQRRWADVFAAADEDLDGVPNNRHETRHLGSHLGCEEGKRVPGKQIAAKPESEAEKQQYHSGNPGEFARFAVGA